MCLTPLDIPGVQVQATPMVATAVLIRGMGTCNPGARSWPSGRPRGVAAASGGRIAGNSSEARSVRDFVGWRVAGFWRGYLSVRGMEMEVERAFGDIAGSEVGEKRRGIK